METKFEAKYAGFVWRSDGKDLCFGHSDGSIFGWNQTSVSDLKDWLAKNSDVEVTINELF